SFPDTALDPDLTAMRVDDSFRDRQSQAGSASARSVRRLPVPVEDTIEMLACDPRTGVPHRKNQLPVAVFRAHDDPAVARRELDRVAEQVPEHLNDSTIVRHDERKIRWYACGERDPVVLGFD